MTRPLTHSQRQIWTGQAMAPASPLYNTPFAFHIEGSLDPRRFEKAFQAAIDRCEALRMVIASTEDGAPARQYRPVEFSLPFVDLRGEANPDHALESELQRRSGTPFDLSERLFDAALFQSGERSFVWFFNQHHLATDAWSVGVIYRLVDACYRALPEGPLPPATPAFEEYAQFEAWGREGTSAASVAHWKHRAETMGAPALLYGRDNPLQETRSVRLERALGAKRSAALRRLAAREDIRSFSEDLTLLDLLATACFALLQRVTGGESLALGTLSHNRSTPEFKASAGLFIEQFPLQIDAEPTVTFDNLLARTRAETQSFLFHARPGCSAPSSARGINTVLNFITSTFPPFADLETVTRWLHPGHSEPSHALRISVHDLNGTGSLQLIFDLNCKVFPASVQETVPGHFIALLDALIADPAQPIQEVPMLAPDEQAQVIAIATGPEMPDPDDSLVGVFDSVTHSAGERLAVIGEGATLSYRELQAHSRSIAAQLQAAGVRKGDFVGLLANRTPATIAGLMGIVRAGAVYMPIAPDNPPARTAFMQEDAGARIVVSEAEVEGWSGPRLDPADPRSDGEPEPVPLGPGDLAYLLYTSGSTGKPKGVLIEHGNVLSLTDVLAKEVFADLPSPCRIAMVAPLTFDVSVQQVFCALMLGHVLCLVPAATRRDGAELLRFFHDFDVDVSDGTPTHLALLARGAPDGPSSARVRNLLISGQELPPATIRDFFERYPGDEPIVTNLYGPTECAVNSSAFPITREQVDAIGERTSIGPPFPGESIYIMSGSVLQPLGAPGELVIAGSGVGRGYHGHARDQGFVFEDDEFKRGQRRYRTGDLARVDQEGRIDFLGRRDHQVKIRGFRIELGEVEAALREVLAEATGAASIQVVATARSSKTEGDAALCAYYVIPSGALPTDELRAELARRLPPYMVPQHILPIPTIPVTENGKIDHKALPDPGTGPSPVTELESGPAGLVEEMIAKIWMDVLEVPVESAVTSFLNYGGASLQAMDVMLRITKELGVSLTIQDIFEAPTVRELAVLVERELDQVMASEEDGET